MLVSFVKNYNGMMIIFKNPHQLETHTEVFMDQMTECLKYALKYPSKMGRGWGRGMLLILKLSNGYVEISYIFSVLVHG